VEYWLLFWWVFPIALAICVTVCTVGISGAVLFVPFFTLAFPALGIPLTPTQAVQVGLFTEIFGFASSTSAFWRNRLIDFRIARFALLFAAPLAVFGGVLANILPGNLVLIAVSVAMLVFSYLLFRAPAEEPGGRQEEAAQGVGAEEGAADEDTAQVEHRDRLGRTYRYQRTNDPLRAVAMAVGGLFEGLVGFSVGEIGITEQMLRGIPIRVAIGTSHLVIAGSATAAALTHVTVVLQRGEQIPWNLMAMTVPAVLLGGQLAGWLAGRVPEDALRRGLAAFLVALALLTGLRAASSSELPIAGWALVAAVLFLVGIIGLLLWKRRELAAKLCYISGGYYCPPSGPPG
jgi:uncharacterized membrane protein YfcA